MKERIITGAIGGSLFVGALLYGGVIFHVLVFLMALLGYKELLGMMKVSSNRLESIIGYSFLTVLFFLPYANEFGLISPEKWIVGLILAFMIIMLFSTERSSMEKIGAHVIGLIYIGYGFLAFAEMREERGFLMVLFILFLIWITDSGAYFLGKKFGKTKLFEKVSPKKTIEGSIGGSLAAILLAGVFYYTTGITEFSLIAILSFSLVVSISGQIGDLIESAIKRFYRVKDSGKILPGHGGILDRFDSLLFVFIMLYLFNIL